MVHVARLYTYMDIMVVILTLLCFMVAVAKTTIVMEEVRIMRGHPNKTRILNNVYDPLVTVKRLILFPGTDFIYIPLYAYYRKGVEYTTISYKKCKRESEANRRK